MIAGLSNLRALVLRNEKFFSWGAFLTGFTWDNLTFTRIDQQLDLLILIGLFSVATAGLLLINLKESGRTLPRWFQRASLWFPLVMQFSLGGLFSGLFVFYSRSGTLIAAWPFLLLIALLLIGNEFFRDRYFRFIFQGVIYYIALFSLTILLTPVLLGQMGEGVFVFSAAVSLLIAFAVFRLVRFIAPARYAAGKRILFLSLAGVYLMMHILYFTNIIPPIPLALKDIGVFHKVERLSSGDYQLSYETPPWYAFWRQSDKVFHLGDLPAYCFSAVFAPTDLDTKIYHSWERYNPQSEKWQVVSRIPFAIYGGRDGGFRGYTLKYAVEPGKWRCDVETARGQLIGRKTFTAIPGAHERPITTDVR